jgi:GntR family transcriptional repressor for pyruvate dehydrogenase complex
MPFETIKKSNTPLKIVDQILRHLEEGELRPGDKLPSERDLCAKFGVGRSSVREAIRILVVMGYLESLHGKGTFLKTAPQPPEAAAGLEAAPVEDLLEAWELIATGLARMAAERAQPENLQDLAGLFAALETSESVADYWDGDMAFHMAVARAAGNLVLLEMLRAVLVVLNEYKTYFLAGFGGRRQEALALTRDMLRNIERGQPVQAVVNMRKRIGLMDFEWAP